MKTIPAAAATVSLVLAACAVGRAQAVTADRAQEPAAATTPRLPVREVTVFKDGHAYVLREEALRGEALGADGRVVLEELPVPVLGTFWPYATGGARLVSATAGREQVETEVEAANVAQLLDANAGKPASIVTEADARIEGRLLERKGSLALIAVDGGTRAIAVDSIRELEIAGELATTFRTETLRERLTLRVDGGGPESPGAPGATVGVVYVQQGLRWIPSYKLDIAPAETGRQGRASVSLEATLVNDLIDLEGATVHLVIGVPRFEFAGLVDPISLQQEVAQVSARMDRNARLSNVLSNSLMTQSAVYDAGAGAAAPSEDPAVRGGEANEDLFVFTVENVSLKKGERMVLPIETFELDYRDVYTLDVSFAPPMELRERMPSDRVLELVRELAAPRAQHVLRLKNTSAFPLTTAPALVLSRGRVLAQGHMRYAPVGTETDLAINTAIDIQVEASEEETGRVPDALRWRNDTYGRIDLAGAIELGNRKDVAVELEVVRRVLGLANDVGQDGTKTQLDFASMWRGAEGGGWWSWWSWPYWWFRFNGFGEFRWSLTLAPGEERTLEATWHYFWR